jgi:hypothetical protein
MANIKISAAAQDNFNKIKIGDRVLSQDEYQRFSRKLQIVMYDVSASIQENYSKIKWDEYQRFLRKLQIVMDDVSASMKKISDDFTQFDEDKTNGFYSYKEKYSNYLKEKKGFIDPKYIDFISFWIEYNSKYLDLKYCFDDKYKLVPGDYFLYIEYEALIFFDRKTKEEALEIVWKVNDTNRSSPPAAKGMDNKAVEDKKPNKQNRPKAKVLMAFIELINKQTEIIPKPSEYSNNDEKFIIIADRIRVKFNYDFSFKTLKKEQYNQEGFSLEVYNLLIEWEYNTIATKYKAYNNR